MSDTVYINKVRKANQKFADEHDVSYRAAAVAMAFLRVGMIDMDRPSYHTDLPENALWMRQNLLDMLTALAAVGLL